MTSPTYLIVIGIVLVIIGVILFFVKISKKKSLFSVLSAPKKKAKELTDMAKQIAEELGAGSYNERCKIWGKVVADKPLISELANKECVYYSCSVYRKFETFETRTDSSGKETRERVTKEELVSSNTNYTPFRLDDGSGQVEISLEGANIQDTVRVLDQFVPGDPGGSSLSFGRFTFSLGNIAVGQSTTLGYRYEEQIIPVDRNLLIVGEANDTNGNVVIKKPADKNYKYIVSLKSEDEWVSSAKKSINALNIAGPVVLIAGGVFVVLYFVMK